MAARNSNFVAFLLKNKTLKSRLQYSQCEKQQQNIRNEENIGHNVRDKHVITNFLLTCVCVCVCVCVCLYSSTCRLFPTARRLWHTWDVQINDLVVVSIARGFCQVPSSPFPNLSYFTSKDVTPSHRKTGEKTIWYTGILQKDDIYCYRI